LTTRPAVPTTEDLFHDLTFLAKEAENVRFMANKAGRKQLVAGLVKVLEQLTACRALVDPPRVQSGGKRGRVTG
jgi:hypothetical protein